MTKKDGLYVIAALTIWVGGLYAATKNISLALTLTGALVVLGLIGKYGSQILEDWQRGREARQDEEHSLDTKELLRKLEDRQKTKD